MKQAILLLIHKDYIQVEKLIRFFNGNCDIFVHIDRGGSITLDEEKYISELPGVKLVNRKYKVNWAGFSILRAEIYLLKQAIENSNAEYFHLISGQDYPIKPLYDFLSFFSHTNSDGYINCNHLPCDITDGATYHRLQHYVLSDFINTRTQKGKNRVWGFVNWQKRHGIKRRIPDYFDHLYGGAAWFSIRRNVAEFLVNYTIKHPQFYNRMKFTYIPEEIYVPTVILNSPFKNNIIWKNNCRTILWNSEGIDFSPINIKDKDFRRLLNNPIGFFSRKFDWSVSAEVIKKIDYYLLERKKYVIDESGGWINRGLNGYIFDTGLNEALIGFCLEYKLNSVCDLGCGPGWYVSNLRNKGISAIGYDYNPYTPELSLLMEGGNEKSCGIVDLSKPICVRRQYDLLICISVAQYIPILQEDVFIQNMLKFVSKYMVVIWGDSSSWGEGVVNPKTPENVINTICKEANMIYNEIATKQLRKKCHNIWYRNTLLVFQKYTAK